MTALAPGLASAQLDATCSTLSPAWQPMPTTSARWMCGLRRMASTRWHVSPGIRKPVLVATARNFTSSRAMPARASALSIACHLADEGPKGFSGRFESGTLKLDTGLVHSEIKPVSFWVHEFCY
jgi:hypothetical protein